MKQQLDGTLKASNPRVNLNGYTEQCYANICQYGEHHRKILREMTRAINIFLATLEKAEGHKVHRLTKGPYHDVSQHATNCITARYSKNVTIGWVRGNVPLAPGLDAIAPVPVQSPEASLLADAIATAAVPSQLPSADAMAPVAVPSPVTVEEIRAISPEAPVPSQLPSADPMAPVAVPSPVTVEEIRAISPEASRPADAAPVPVPSPLTLEGIRTHLIETLVPMMKKDLANHRTKTRRLNEGQRGALYALETQCGDARNLKERIEQLLSVYNQKYDTKQVEQFWPGMRNMLNKYVVTLHAL